MTLCPLFCLNTCRISLGHPHNSAMATPSLSSSEVIHKLEEQLTCPICLEQYTNPKFLPCFHSFCSKCLGSVPLERPQQGNYNLPCPTCRSPCQLPQQGVQAFPSSFTINNLTEVYNLMKKVSGNRHASCDNCNSSEADRYCKQCAKFLCQPCLAQHDKWITDHQTLDLDEVVNTAYQLPQVKQEATSNCADHGKLLEIYCEKCELVICQLCTVKKHKDHEYDVVCDAFAKHKLTIESSLQPLQQQIHRLAEALATLIKRREEIADQGEKVKNEIHLEITQIKQLLDQTKIQLVKEVDVALKYKLDVTIHQTREAEGLLHQLTECNDHVQQSLKVGTPHQILKTKSQMIKRTENLIATSKEQTFDLFVQADIEFVKQGTLDDTIQNIGKISHATSFPSSVTSSHQHIPLVGQQSTISVCLSLQDGRPAPVPSSLIKLQLSPPDGKESIQCSIKESSQPAGQYNVVFTPNTRGVHQLHVTILDSALPGSPMSIPVCIPVKMRDTPVKTIGTGLNKPTGIAVTDDGQVIVCERDCHCVTVIDSKGGRKVRLFGSHGSGRGQLSNPKDVAITSKGTLLVTDWSNHRIQVFTMDGECKSCVGSEGNGPLQFNSPSGIAINKTTGQVYVADFGNHRVQVLNADLTFSHMFGSYGSGQGQFKYLCGVAIDSQGLVYVADSNNHRIQQFTPEGKHLSSFGTKGSAPGQLTFPRDITVDDNDLLYICEGRPNDHVSVFTTTGEFVHCLGQGTLGNPHRSVIDMFGYLYVSDYSECVIKIF